MPGSKAPKLGPEPTLISRKEVDSLYVTFQAVIDALEKIGVDYIVTGGSLLGAIRQHSILFCDDDIDIAVIDIDGAYEKVANNLQEQLGPDFRYTIRPWEGGDRIRPVRASNAFLDLFALRRYDSVKQLKEVIGVKKNGSFQSDDYVKGIVAKIQSSAFSQSESQDLCPFWHFSTRKAIEMWSKEVYRESELFPLATDLKFGPMTCVKGPRMPVLLLKRAFGKDCFKVYYQSVSHNNGNSKRTRTSVSNGSTPPQPDNNEGSLPPLTSLGGTWESGTMAVLKDEHYLPMQPLSRASRRPTMHNRESLFIYLEHQTRQEEEWMRLGDSASATKPNTMNQQRPRRTVYMDGVFDLFHIGHLEAIRQCARLGDRVILGVTGDEDAAGYKRRPVISEKQRVAVVGALKEVDHVVCPCPLIVTEEFMEQHNIDLVVHGFANDADAKRQEEFFQVPMKSGRFQRIDYYEGQSTSDIINKIQSLKGAENGATKQWFGSNIAAASNNAAHIPFDPFPLKIRQVMEPQIRKSNLRRNQVLHAIREANGDEVYDSTMESFRKSGLASEDDFAFDPIQYPLLTSLLECGNLPADTDLSRIHETPGAKDRFLYDLTRRSNRFQAVFDDFVREMCVPHFAAKLDGCTEVYYQAFPCVRVIQPDEFSIGPHADSMYGHHPCSVNFYVLLTNVEETSASVFIESRPGSEDWHPIVGNLGTIKRFAGAICMHWTSENKTEKTRVSLDFRLIDGTMYHALECGGSRSGGQMDVYRTKEGYYSRCSFLVSDDRTRWQRDGQLLKPDARNGFPWTVKNWS